MHKLSLFLFLTIPLVCEIVEIRRIIVTQRESSPAVPRGAFKKGWASLSQEEKKELVRGKMKLWEKALGRSSAQ